jgi:hypothetical protein
MLIAVFKALFYPLWLLVLGIDVISGENRWYWQQRRRMEDDRPPLPDAEYLRSVPVEPGEKPLWLAVRRAVAEPTGLPAEAIYPQDRIADLWRMQWEGPDHLDLVLRLERTLAIRIGRPMTETIAESIRSHRDEEFGEFAAAVVQMLGKATRPTQQVSAQLAGSDPFFRPFSAVSQRTLREPLRTYPV